MILCRNYTFSAISELFVICFHCLLPIICMTIWFFNIFYEFLLTFFRDCMVYRYKCIDIIVAILYHCTSTIGVKVFPFTVLSVRTGTYSNIRSLCKMSLCTAGAYFHYIGHFVREKCIGCPQFLARHISKHFSSYSPLFSIFLPETQFKANYRHFSVNPSFEKMCINSKCSFCSLWRYSILQR